MITCLEWSVGDLWIGGGGTEGLSCPVALPGQVVPGAGRGRAEVRCGLSGLFPRTPEGEVGGLSHEKFSHQRVLKSRGVSWPYWSCRTGVHRGAVLPSLGEALSPGLAWGCVPQQLHRLHTGLSPWPCSLLTIKKKKSHFTNGFLHITSAVRSAYTLFHNWPIQYTLFRIFNQRWQVAPAI